MKHLLFTALLACAAGQALGQAQPQTAPTGPQAWTCGHDMPQPLTPQAFTEPPSASYSPAQRACWANWPLAWQIATGPGGQWVDVRDQGARDRLALPGVMAVDLASLPDKAALKGQSLVLVGTGVDLHALSAQCAALRQSGQFQDVRVLLHGVRAWRLAGQPVWPTGPALPADEVSAQELWLGAADKLWHLAAIGLNDEQLKRLPLAAAWVTDAKDIRQAVQALAIRTRAKTPTDDPRPQRWLVLTATPAQLAEVRALWSEAHAHATADGDKGANAQADSLASSQPLWLAGAWPGYARYIEHQTTLSAHAGQTLPRLCGQ